MQDGCGFKSRPWVRFSGRQDMRLATIPNYKERTPQGLIFGGPYPWELERVDVVDLSGFLYATVTSQGEVCFTDGRNPEPIVLAVFSKGTRWITYNMPLSEFREVMGTQLSPSVPEH